MIRSMTGYGEAERDAPSGRLRVEIRTVNHRFFHLNARGPSGFDRLVPTVERWLREQLSRGHVQLTMTLSRGEEEGQPPIDIDLDRARGYRDALDRLQDELGVPGEIDLRLLSQFSRELFRVPEESRQDPGIDPEVLRIATEEASRAAVKMREEEGARLHQDLSSRIEAMRDLLEGIRQRAPERLVQERDRLREAVAELAGGVGVDEDRLAREVAHMAERWDLSEEIVRFEAHLEAFSDAMEADAAKAVGKRLAFLVQELLREANTIASKANDAAIAHAAVSLKEEIERVREQVENVE